MKTNELRIDNWIKDHGETGEKYQVTEITQDGLTAGPMTIYPAGMVYEYGIPLTEEWLKRLEFEDDQITWSKGPLWFPSGNIQEDWVFWINGDLSQQDGSLKYVHQLQNLYFALTGEELMLRGEVENNTLRGE